MSILSAIHIIAERRIEEAIKEGKLNNLSYKNRPLPDENTQLIPEDMRMAYKMLKNAGYLPPEIETRKEINRIEELIAKTDDEHTRVKQLRKLNFLNMKLESMRNRSLNLGTDPEYHRQVTERITLNSEAESR